MDSLGSLNLILRQALFIDYHFIAKYNISQGEKYLVILLIMNNIVKMNWKEFREEMKKDPHGADALEADDRLTQVFEELRKDTGGFVIWLTGLSIGEVAFILSNLDKIFVGKGFLFIISASLLIICIFTGLVYHLLEIIRLLNKRRLYFGVRQQSLKQCAENVKYVLLKSTLGQNVKISKENYNKVLYFVALGIEWSWKVNVFAFSIGSVSLIVLVSIKIFT
jgi:radical SAM superfamily enzyme YgiQ (UPF0313 family)